jgi:hypothetical protein
MSNVGTGVVSGSNTLNGLNTITFPDGSANYLQTTTSTIANSENLAVFVVASIFPSQTHQYNDFYTRQSFFWRIDRSDQTLGVSAFPPTAQRLGVISPGSLAGSNVLFTHHRRHNIFTVRLNGTTYSNQTASVAGIQSSIAATMGLRGGSFHMCEFILVNMSTAAGMPVQHQRALEGYLAWKWGLQRTLPSNHPYRFERP